MIEVQCIIASKHFILFFFGSIRIVFILEEDSISSPY